MVATGSTPFDEPLVSIVIPVLNDREALASLLPTLRPDPAVEIIVVDSSDEHDPAMAALRAAYRPVIWMRSPTGRGAQMNRGAREARGRWLLFLHADTRLDAGWIDTLRRVEAQAAIVGGSFTFALDSPTRWARWIERGVRMRVRVFNLPYGDQALFVRRTIFGELGGYQELPLMEDVELVGRLRRRGRLEHARVRAVTSARRWERDGWIRRSLENIVLTILFLAGHAPKRLAHRYRRHVTR